MQWLPTVINLSLTILSFVAVTMARSSLLELRRRLAARSSRSLMQLDAEVTNLTSTCASLSSSLRRVTSRQGMQDVRARQKQELKLPENDPAARKRALKDALARGLISKQAE